MLNNVEYQIKAFEILQNVFVKYSKCESDYRFIRDSMAELEELNNNVQSDVKVISSSVILNICESEEHYESSSHYC